MFREPRLFVPRLTVRSTHFLVLSKQLAHGREAGLGRLEYDCRYLFGPAVIHTEHRRQAGSRKELPG